METGRLAINRCIMNKQKLMLEAHIKHLLYVEVKCFTQQNDR